MERKKQFAIRVYMEPVPVKEQLPFNYERSAISATSTYESATGAYVSATGYGPKLSRDSYSLREAAGIAGISVRLFRKRMTELFHGTSWYVTFGRRISVPRGALLRYFDRGGLYCPHCRRRYTTPQEHQIRDSWR